MAANITFGNFPANMSDQTSWGFGDYLSDQNPVPAGIPTSTVLNLVDPGTGTTLQLSGAFDISGLLQGNFTTSTVSSAVKSARIRYATVLSHAAPKTMK